MKRILVLVNCGCCGEREIWTESSKHLASLLRGHSAWGIRVLEERDFPE